MASAGRHWLDVVRYAESGYRADGYRPDTWRYRDYVIRSFNDKPYDQFVREQLAADEFAPHDPETLIGTAFGSRLRMEPAQRPHAMDHHDQDDQRHRRSVPRTRNWLRPVPRPQV